MLPEGNRAQRDDNRIPLLAGVSYLNNQALVQGTFDPATGAQLVSVVSGGGSGTQYTNGATAPTNPVGTYPVYTNSSGIVTAVSSTNPLPVTGGSGGTQYAEGTTTYPATGTAALGRYQLSPRTLTDGQLAAPLLDNLGQLKVVPLGTSSQNLTQINGNAVVTAANGLQSHAISNGTNTADVVLGDTGFNGLVNAAGTKSYTFSTSGAGAQMLGPFATEGYSFISIQYTTNTTAGLVLTGQFSQTLAGTYAMVNTFTNNASGANTYGGLAATTGTYYESPIKDNFFRINITALTSGSLAGTITLSNRSSIPGAVFATQNGTWTVGSNSATGSAIPANAFYIGGISSGNLVGIQARPASSDAFTASVNALMTASENTLYNGSTWDLQRANITGNILTGQTSPTTSTTQTTYNASKLVVIINISAYTSGSLTFTVNAITSSGYSYPIIASTALAATGTTPLRIFPGSTPSANAVANDTVPRQYQVVVSGTFVATYGVDYELSV